KCFNIGSLDQLIGVGVGLGGGVALRVGDGVCAGAGVWEEIGFSACAANAPSVIATAITAQIAAISPPKSRVELHVSFIGETSFRLIYDKETAGSNCQSKKLLRVIKRS